MWLNAYVQIYHQSFEKNFKDSSNIQKTREPNADMVAVFLFFLPSLPGGVIIELSTFRWLEILEAMKAVGDCLDYGNYCDCFSYSTNGQAK